MSETSIVNNAPASDPLDAVSQRRGKNIAVTGFVVQLVLSGVLLLVWKLTYSLAAMSLGWMMVSGSLLWLMSAILFYVRQLACQENLELEQISRQADAGSIFEANDLSLRPAAKRVAFVLKWVAPVFSLILALYLIGAGLAVMRSIWLTPSDVLPVSQAQASLLTICIFATVGLGFAAFLFSRYATGMGSQLAYRPLRATGSYMLVCVLGSLVLAVGLILAYTKYYAFDRYIGLVIPVAALVFAVEIVFNFILDIYRPRVRGQEPRLVYDSRLLNLLAEPGRVGQGMAEALNYQFGFEVSKTWFYQLLSRALLPLVLAGVLIMVLLTSVVLVPEGEQAVVFVMGKARPETLKHGLNVKPPWPFASAERINTADIHELFLGTGHARTGEEVERNYVTSPATGRKAEVHLWTNEHGARKENDFLVAVPASRDNPAAVNVIKLVTRVQYSIADPYKFSYTYNDAQALLESVAYQEMVRYLASATLLEEDDTYPNRPQAIMTTGRQQAARTLMERIRERVGESGLDLGVTLVNVDFQSVHPPASAAEAFEKVLAAERGRDVRRYEAQKQANLILAQVAGTPSAALRLAFAIEKYQELESISLSQGSVLTSRVENALKRAEDGLSTLQEEIERDELSGLGTVAVPVPGDDAAADESADVAGAGDSLAEKRLLRVEYVQYIATLRALKADANSVDVLKELDDAGRRADALFAKAQGEPAKLLAAARADRWSKEMAERARAETFDRELTAFEAAPRLYVFDRWMDVMDQTLPNIPKLIITAPRTHYEIWQDNSRGTGAMQGALEELGR